MTDVRRSTLAMVTVLAAGFSPQLPASQDVLKQHCDAASAYQRAGDYEHATAEPPAFLAEAFLRIASYDESVRHRSTQKNAYPSN